MVRIALELLACTIVAAVATWPLALHLASIDRPTDPSQDEFVFYWNFWWTKKALFEHAQSPLFCSQIFYPYGTSLAVTPLTFLFCLLSLPFTIALRMPDALFFTTKLFIFATYPLALHGAYRLLRALGLPVGSAVLGALLFAFAPFRLLHLVRLHYLCNFWVPYFLLASLHLLRGATPRRVAAAGVTFALLGLSDLSLMPELLFALAALWATYALRTRTWWRPALRIALGCALGVALDLPYAIPIAHELRSNPAVDLQAKISFTQEPSELQLLLSPDLNNLGFLLAPDTHRALFPEGSDVARGSRFNRYIWDGLRPMTLPRVPVAALGIALILAVLGASVLGARRRELWPFAALAVLGAVLALGPSRVVFGHPLPMPFHFLSQLVPALKASRYPATFLRLTNLGIAVLAAAGLSRLPLRWRISALTLSLLWAASCVLMPNRFEPMPFEPAYAPIIADPVAGTVLELPPDTEIMRRRSAFAMLLHERPLLGAPITRVRRDATAFFNETPVCGRLMTPPHPRVLDSPKVQREIQENRTILDQYRVRYIVVRPAMLYGDPVGRDYLKAYLRAHEHVTIIESGAFFLVRLD